VDENANSRTEPCTMHTYMPIYMQHDERKETPKKGINGTIV